MTFMQLYVACFDDLQATVAQIQFMYQPLVFLNSRQNLQELKVKNAIHTDIRKVLLVLFNNFQVIGSNATNLASIYIQYIYTQHLSVIILSMSAKIIQGKLIKYLLYKEQKIGQNPGLFRLTADLANKLIKEN